MSNPKVIRTLLASSSFANLAKGMRLLADSGGLEFLNDALAMLKHPDDSVRRSAVAAVSGILKRNLIHHFSELSPSVREGMAKIMRSLDPNVIDHIAGDLHSDQPGMRFRAVQVLGCMGQNPRIRELLTEMLTDRNEKVRATAVSLLGAMAKEIELGTIGRLLNDPDNRVVANCVETLEAVGNPRIVDLLLKIKSHPNNRVQGNVLKALWNLGYKEIHSELRTMLENSDDHLFRATACWVIGQVADDGEKPMLEMLVPALKDSHPLVRENAIKAQLRIGGKAVSAYLEIHGNPEEVDQVRRAMEAP